MVYSGCRDGLVAVAGSVHFDRLVGQQALGRDESERIVQGHVFRVEQQTAFREIAIRRNRRPPTRLVRPTRPT